MEIILEILGHHDNYAELAKFPSDKKGAFFLGCDLHVSPLNVFYSRLALLNHLNSIF